MRVIAVRASVERERDAALLLAFERATTGFGWSRPGRSALAGNTVYTLLPGEPAAAARRGSRRCARLCPEADGDGRHQRRRRRGGPPAARQEADECLACTREAAGAGPPAYDESWDEILLQRLRTAARSGRAPTEDRWPSCAATTGHATEYVATLRAWLEAQGDPAAAGERLGVHENTVRTGCARWPRSPTCT